MKKALFTLLILLTFGLLAQAQNISVKDFYYAENDLTARTHGTKVEDQNGYLCALIKVRTTEKGMWTFDVGMLGVTKTEMQNANHSAEIWVYVPFGVTRMTIQHEKLGILDKWPFPCSIEKGCTYVMELTTGKVITVVEEVVNQQYLAFQITPADAVLEVNGKIWEVDADGNAQEYVSFGSYEYRVQAPNYHPAVGKVNVNDPDNTVFKSVTLNPNFGWIEVGGTGDLKGANVYIDNALIGKAPCKSEALKSGQHTVRIAKKMYDTYSVTVTVNDNETTTVNPVLEANFATVTLSVDADAEIWVNNERKGIRTWTGALGYGSYKVECKQANHETRLTTLEVTAALNGETLPLPSPTPIYGSLNVESTPKFCRLFIDGKDMGATPKSVNQILIGQHEIRLTKEGYAEHRETITITKGERKQVNATMNKQEGQPLLANNTNSGEDQTFTVNNVSFAMKLVEGGTFQMGATSEQGSEAENDEKPAHNVTLSSYYMGETEVTQALWKAVMGDNPSYFKGDNLPVEQVSWNDCQEFIRKLNQKTGKNFRLPTEAEWEYAARGGKKSNGYKYAGSNNIGSVAWYIDNSSSNTHAVKGKWPNELGLYDMSGNVCEWCNDWYGSDYYGKSPSTNPQGPSSGSNRVLRGGSWYDRARYCRVSYRRNSDPGNRNNDLGFRLCLPQ